MVQRGTTGTACSVHRSNSGWRVIWAEQVEGKRRQRSRSFDEQRDADRWAAIVRAQGITEALRRLAEDADRERIITLDEWLTHHLENNLVVKPGTRVEYERLARRTWQPQLGPLPIHAVTRDSIVRWVRWASEDRDPPFSAKTISNAHGLLSAVLRSAVEAGHITSNPCRGVRMPRNHATEERPWITEEEFVRLLGEMPAFYRPLVAFLGTTGARFGEATALQWRDLNLPHGLVTIRRNWHKVGGKWVESSTKTRRSTRTFGLSPSLVQILVELKATTKDPSPTALVFVGRNGGQRIWPCRFLTSTWHPARIRAGLPDGVTPHTLRHSHGTWQVARGTALPALQQRLGHESITTTINTYGHLTADVVATSVANADAVLALGR